MRESNLDSQYSGGVDLFDLLKGVWVQRWLVLIVAGLMTLAVGAYAFLSTPVYEARTYVLPPTQNDIEEFNFGRTAETGMAPYSVKDIYAVFIRNLQSESLRYQFFSEIYVPSLGESGRQRSQSSLYRQFSADLTIGQPGKDFAERFSVITRNNQPAQAADWLRLYVDRASEMTKKELIRNFTKEVQVHLRGIETQIAMLRENAANARQDTILQLREAEKVAGAIGLENHQVVSGNAAGDMSGMFDPRLIYLRGTKALGAEIKNLQARESDDAYIADLPRLQGLHEFYKSLAVKAEDVAVYRLDGVIQSPDSPVRPGKALILVLGLVLGLSLGVLFAVMRQFLLQRRRQPV